MSARRGLFCRLLVLILLPGAWGCESPPSSSTVETEDAGSTDEAERTRKMQELAAEIERDAEEIRTMEGTEEEKLEALNRLEEKRQELNDLAEGDRD